MRHTNTDIAITLARYRAMQSNTLLRMWLAFWGFLRGPAQ
jgi:hypothetical protein